MSDVVIVALISLAGTFLGSFSGMKLMSFRIDRLEKAVEKMSDLSERMAVAENKIAVADHRITDLEKRDDK